MPPKRNRSPNLMPATANNRRWLRFRCDAVNAALLSAEKLSYIGPRWSTADNLLSEFGAVWPQILLPAELSDRIVALKLDLFPPELWRITAAYAVCHQDDVIDGIDRILFARVVCLYSIGGRSSDAALLSAPLLRMPNSKNWLWQAYDFYWLDLAAKLFISQQYEYAINLYERCLELTGNKRYANDIRIFLSLSYSFVGKIEQARLHINRVPITVDIRGWSDAAVQLASDRPDRRLLSDLQRSMNRSQRSGGGFDCLLTGLVQNLLQTNWPDADTTSNSALLRSAHAAALATHTDKWMAGAGWLNLMNTSCPRLESAWMPAMDGGRKPKNKRLKPNSCLSVFGFVKSVL